MLQTKHPHTAKKTPARCKQNSSTLQTKELHAANKPPALCKENSSTLQTKAKVLCAQDEVKDWALVLWFSWFMAEFLRREIHEGVMKTQTPRILKKGLVNSSQFL